MPSQKYLDTLQLYYEEEVEGEAYFDEAAKAFDDPLVREKLILLAECERHAAEAVEPLVHKYVFHLILAMSERKLCGMMGFGSCIQMWT